LSKTKRSNLRELFSQLKDYKFLVAGNIISNILTSIFSLLAIPLLIPLLDLLFFKIDKQVEFPEQLLTFEDFEQYLSAFFLQYAANYGQQRAILYVCMFFMGTIFLTNFFRYLSLYLMAPVRQGIVFDLRNRVFSKMIHLPLSYFSEERKGDLMSRLISDVQEVEWSILKMLEALFRNPVMIIGVLAFMFYASPSLTLFVFVLILIAVGLISFISRTLRRKSYEAQDLLGYLGSIIEEALGGLRIIKSFNAEKYQKDKFFSTNNKYRSLMVGIKRRQQLASPFSEFMGVSIALILIYYGSSRVLQGELNASSFMAYLFAFFRLIDPAKSLSNAYFNIEKGRAALDRLDRIIKVDSSITSKENAIPILKLNESLYLEDVCFKYGLELPLVLDHVHLEIKKGMTVALVGESGSGKSTLVDLLPRFYDVTKGSVSIDGIDVRDLNLDHLRNLFGIVSQEPVLFNDSIINNITFGEYEDRDRVMKAAKIAHAHDFIMEAEQGYDTVIGDRGVKLSGGQRQRITIARAIYKNPEVLIFDEATSALDSESEKLVQDALLQATKGRTSIIIAHRLSTIQNADWIVVLEKGCIKEQGKHDDLLELNGLYARLVRMQSL
jgi:subfamily B ATP-binding cassette protein MsbA